MNINKLLSLSYIDPKTGNKLKHSKRGLESGKKVIGRIAGDKLYFLDQKTIQNFTKERDLLDNLKSVLKFVFGKNYKLLIWVVSQHMPRIHWSTRETLLSFTVKKYARKKKIVLNLGSGNDRYNDIIINVDIFPFKEVDLIAKAENLPFSENYVDGLVNTELLEHVENPEEVIREAFRVLKKGGFIITAAPFIEGFHGSPKDFYRWSHLGIKQLHERNGFKTESLIPLAGPTASFISIAQSYLALLLSFNMSYLYYFWILALIPIFLPLKLLDFLLINFSMSYTINASNLYIGRK